MGQIVTHTKKKELSSSGNTCCDFEMPAALTTQIFEQVVIQIGNSYPSKRHFPGAQYSVGVNTSGGKVTAFDMSNI